MSKGMGIALVVVVILASTIRAAAPATMPATAATSQPVIDKTTPIGVAKLFLAAECDADFEVAREYSIDFVKRDAVLRAYAAKMNGQVVIDAALAGKFGKPAPRKPGDYSDQAKRAFEALDAAGAEVSGSIARIRVDPGPLIVRRINGKWRVDPRSLYPDVLSNALDDVLAQDMALGQAAKEIAQEIRNGVYETPEKALEAAGTRLEAVMKEHADRMQAKQ